MGRILIPPGVLALFLSEAILIPACFIAALYLTPEQDPEIFVFYESGFARVAIVSLLLVLGLYFNDLYSEVRIRSRILLLQKLSSIVGIGLLAQALLGYLKQDLTLPKNVMLIGSGLSLVVLVVWRILFSVAVRNAVDPSRVLFLGTSPTVLRLGEHLNQNPDLGLSPVAYLEAPRDSVTDLMHTIDEVSPHWIVIGGRQALRPWWVDEFLDIRFGGIRAENVSSLYERTFGRVPVTELDPANVIFTNDMQSPPRSIQIQWVYSFLLALTATLVTLPVMALIAAVLKVESRGPIFVKQACVGLNGALFTRYRFRTTYPDAEVQLTPVGRILNRYRLDCLPYLFSILQGNMSLIGPRAEPPGFVARLSEEIPFYRQRHTVIPGLTGWAQVNGYAGTTDPTDTIQMLEYDLFYIKNLSPALDLVILMRSAKALLQGRRDAHG